jgi:hypothetical protein
MSVPRGHLDPARVTLPYHVANTHLILESASPSQRGGSHSKQGCSTDARTVGVVSLAVCQTRTKVIVRTTKKAEKMEGGTYQRGGRGTTFFVFGCLGPPHVPTRSRGTSTRRNVATGGAGTTLRRGLLGTGLALKTRVLEGCAKGGSRVLSLVGCQTSAYARARKKPRKWRGKGFSEEARAVIFLSGYLGSPHQPTRLRGTSPRQNVATGGAATTLVRGLREATAGSTSEYVRSCFRNPFPSYLMQDRRHAGARLG